MAAGVHAGSRGDAAQGVRAVAKLGLVHEGRLAGHAWGEGLGVALWSPPWISGLEEVDVGLHACC